MSPTVDTGGLALTRTVAADELAIGDIVSVTPAAEERVTHRIVGIDGVGRADAADAAGRRQPGGRTRSPIPSPRRTGCWFARQPPRVCGRRLASPYAVFLAGAFVAGLLLVGVQTPEPARSSRRRSPSPRVVAASALMRCAGGADLGVVHRRCAYRPVPDGNLATADVCRCRQSSRCTVHRRPGSEVGDDQLDRGRRLGLLGGHRCRPGRR